MQRNVMYYDPDELKNQTQALLQFFENEILPLPPIPEIKVELQKLLNESKSLAGGIIELEEIPLMTGTYSSEELIKIHNWAKETTLQIVKIKEQKAKNEAKHMMSHQAEPISKLVEKKTDLRLVRQALTDLTTRLVQMESTYLGKKPTASKHGIEIEYTKKHKLHLPKRHIHKSNINNIKDKFKSIELEQKDLQKIVQLKIDYLFTCFNEQIEEHNKKYKQYQKSLLHFSIFEDKPLEKYYDHLEQYDGHDYFRMLGVILHELATKYGSLIGEVKAAQILALTSLISDIYHFSDSNTLVRQRSLSSVMA